MQIFGDFKFDIAGIVHEVFELLSYLKSIFHMLFCSAYVTYFIHILISFTWGKANCPYTIHQINYCHVVSYTYNLHDFIFYILHFI